MLPWKASIAIRPDQLHAIEIIAAVEPAAPAEMILVVPLRYRQQRRVAILEYAVDWRTKRKALALLQCSIDVPERVVGSLALERERDDFGKIELEPEAGRIAEAGPLLVSEHRCVEPAMFANARNKCLLIFIELGRIDVQSCKHRPDIAPLACLLPRAQHWLDPDSVLGSQRDRRQRHDRTIALPFHMETLCHGGQNQNGLH